MKKGNRSRFLAPIKREVLDAYKKRVLSRANFFAAGTYVNIKRLFGIGGQIFRGLCSVDRRGSNSFILAKLIVGGVSKQFCARVKGS